jgi:hypothetical protein
MLPNLISKYLLIIYIIENINCNIKIHDKSEERRVGKEC